MDPTAAGIAFVGFAASLITLVGAAVQGVQVLYTLCDKLQHAPEELQRLSATVQTLESLLLNFKTHFQNEGPDSLLTGFAGLWQDSARQMQIDLGSFEQVVSKFKASIAGKSISRRYIRARLQKYFSDDSIRHWERVLNAHVSKFTLLLTIITDARSTLTLGQIKLQSDQLAVLAEKTSSLPHIHAGIRNLKHFQSTENQKLAALIVDRTATSLDTGWQRASTANRWVGQPPAFPYTYSQQNPAIELEISQESLPNLPKRRFRSISPSPTRSSTPLPYRNTNHDVRKLIYMTWSVYRFPIGILCVTRSGKRIIQNLEKPSEEKTLSFMFAPPPWLSAAIVRVTFTISTMQGRPPGFGWSASSTTWNQDPMLERYVFMCNMSGLKRLFREKRALPTDIFAPSGRSLLHEAVFAHLARKPGSLETCRFLIDAGADLNARDLDGYTPLSLCCYLMQQRNRSKPLEQLMLPLMDIFLSAGGDPALCSGPKGLSTFSHLFSQMPSFGYLDFIIRQYVDIYNFQDLNLFDTWIVATLIRTDSKFRHSLEAQLLEFRSAPTLQTSNCPQVSVLTEFSLSRQVAEMQGSVSSVRVEFMRALSRYGNGAMLEPLLNAGIDVNEINHLECGYLGEAAAAGNYETLVALVNAGACVEGGTLSPAPVALLQRWISVYYALTKQQQVAMVEAEFPLLEELIRVPGLRTERMPYTLSRALRVPTDICFKSILDAGFGVCLAIEPPERKHTSLFGPAWAELIEAVYFDNVAAVELLIARGARLEDEDDVGCTALLTALDGGHLEIVRVLVDAGARVHVRTKSRKSAWDLACENVLASHPRRMRFDHRLMDHSIRHVSAEVDMQAYAILRKSSRRGRQGKRIWSGDPDAYPIFASIYDFLLKIRAELAFEYAAVLQSFARISLTTVFLVILGLALTVPALIFYEAWQGLWRMYHSRSFPAFRHLTAFLLIFCFVCWAAPGSLRWR